MALYGSFSRHKHLSELADPIVSGTGVLSATQRRQAVIDNIFATSTLAMPAVTFAKILTASTYVPTVTTSATTTIEDHGDSIWHVTKLTCTAFAIGTTADNAALAIGAKIMTFPAGTIAVQGTTVVGGVTASISVTTNTPEVGLGTTVGTGAVAVLSTTMEDLMDGGAGATGGDSVAPDVAGTAFYKGSNFTAPVIIKATGGKSHDVFLNIAATWADVTAAGAAVFTGTVTIRWMKVD